MEGKMKELLEVCLTPVHAANSFLAVSSVISMQWGSGLTSPEVSSDDNTEPLPKSNMVLVPD